MIRIESNTPELTLSNEQLTTITTIIAENPALNYDIIEHSDCVPHVALWTHQLEGNPTRHGITPDGAIALFEEVDWNWKGTS